MPAYRCLALVCLSACSLGPEPARAWTVTSRNAVTIDNAAVPGLMELSSLGYRGFLGGSTHALVAVQDSGNQLVTLSFGLAADGALTSAVATATRTLSPGFDFEGVALGPAGSVLIAEENTPMVRRYDEATGTMTDLLSMPPVFGSNRPNFALESLTRGPDGVTYWAANEEALTPDGTLSNTSEGTTVRLQQFSYDSSGTLTLGPQFAYQVDPIHVGTTTDVRTRSGLVDLVALPDSTLLALERSLGISGLLFGFPIYQYESRIYHVTIAGASDTSQAPFDAGLSGQAFVPASKRLLWSGQAGGGFGQNLEGLAIGPQVAGGDWSLLGVVDNGGGSDVLSGNTVVAFALTPPAPGGDYNLDGIVDAADYVVWRKNDGMQQGYDKWSANFGATAGSGSLSNATVPEPASILLLILGAAVGAWPRRRMLRECHEIVSA